MSGNNFVTDIGSAAFEQRVLTSGLALVDFWAEWCGPCRTLGPIVETVAGQNPDTLEVFKVNVDDHPGTRAKLGYLGSRNVAQVRDGHPHLL